VGIKQGCPVKSGYFTIIVSSNEQKKFELMLTRRAKAYNSSDSIV